jgi:ABC-2 type transport system permease protein
MKYSLLVAWREYSESVKAKGFWIGILVMPAMLFFSLQVPVWLNKKAAPVRYFTIVDQSGSFAPVLESKVETSYQKMVFGALNEYARKYCLPKADANSNPTLSSPPLPTSVEVFIAAGGKESFLKQLAPRLKPGVPSFEEPRRLLRSVKAPAGVSLDGDINSVAEALKPYIRGAKKINVDEQWVDLSAAVLIPKDIEKHIVRPGKRDPDRARPAPGPLGTEQQVQYWSINAADSELHDEIENALKTEVQRREYLERGLDAALVREVEQTYAPLVRLNPKKEKGKEIFSSADSLKQWLPSGFVYLLWLANMVTTGMLVSSTIEEKSNRIVEVLLSSVTPGELMRGKLMGIAAIGLTMVSAWMVALFGLLSWKAGGAGGMAGQMLTVLKGSNLIFLFALYFILGYLMYAGFYLSVGSVCNTLKDAQSYTSLLTMVMMVPLLTMTFIPRDPNGTLARFLSWIPIYTPFVMMNRAAADPPLVDLIGTFVLLMVAAVAAIWMAAKIFRIGILRTGQPPKVIEMLRWALRKQN